MLYAHNKTWTYLKANRRIHGTLHTLPNHQHQSTVETISQQGETWWPWRVKLMNNINCNLDFQLKSERVLIISSVC